MGIAGSVELFRIKKQWATLFAPPLSQHTQPVLLKDKELVINVDSNMWLSELFFQREKILKKLVSFNVKSIKLRAGKVFNQIIVDEIENKSDLTNNEIEFINNLGVDIKDNDLLAAIKRAAARSLAYKKN